MGTHLHLVASIAAFVLFLIVLELVRRRRLMERYALLWLFCAGLLFALAVWSGLLDVVSDALGIAYAPSALFVVAFIFVLILLLHFSVAVSRLADQSKVLAQRLALAEERLRRYEARDGETREEESEPRADNATNKERPAREPERPPEPVSILHRARR